MVKVKVREIDSNHIANYLRIDAESLEETERAEIERQIEVAKKYIENYTGLSRDEVEDKEDLTQVIYVLCQDMYDNRSYYVEKNNKNDMVMNILSMHSKNLL